MNKLNAVSVASILAVSSVLALGACSKKPETAPATAEPAAPAATPPAGDAATSPATAAAATAATAAPRTKAPDGAKVSFVGIKDGDTVSSPFKVGFGIEGLKVAPAGTPDPGVGHHHLIIDSELPSQDAPLPATDSVKHFGKGQTETELTLPAGKHTLQLEFADSNHVPFDPPVVSDKITVTVK
jgi:hypothetical protein